jgi:hypothetical protein
METNDEIQREEYEGEKQVWYHVLLGCLAAILGLIFMAYKQTIVWIKSKNPK